MFSDSDEVEVKMRDFDNTIFLVQRVSGSSINQPSGFISGINLKINGSFLLMNFYIHTYTYVQHDGLAISCRRIQ